ncbi:MAG: amidase family protein [Defluviitaleaceae bacterium]|nr:amidase family protein [Defluviitaleaceae bacterium]
MLDIPYLSIKELHEAYALGKVTVKEVVLAQLARIAKIDSCEGGLKSVIELNPESLLIAENLDKRYKKTKEMPPLFGVPVLVKDNIGTGSNMRTSAGSVALADNCSNTAPIIDQLRDTGAIVIGKANMTEFANYMTREGMPNGYSSRGGQTLNPYNREKDVSGSSSGSAAAVAAGLSTLSIGTETSGSIVAPAAANGVVGIKPTIGLITQEGIIPISRAFDTAGPMARNVTDAAILLGILASVNFTKFLEGDDLKGIRIGLNRIKECDHKPEGDESMAAFDKLCETLKAAGAELVDNLELERHYDTRVTIMQHEFKSCMNRYLNNTAFESNVKLKSLKDIIEYNQANAAVALKYGQSLLVESENKFSGNLTEPAYIEALIKREKAITEMDDLFTEHNLDVLLGDQFMYIAPFTGFPSMTMPIGQRKDNNLPLNASWTARRHDEGKMIKIAYIVEKILGITIRPHID